MSSGHVLGRGHKLLDPGKEHLPMVQGLDIAANRCGHRWQAGRDIKGPVNPAAVEEPAAFAWSMANPAAPEARRN